MLKAWELADPLPAPAAAVPASLAALAPHAGWYFSGALAWRSWRSLAQSDIVAVIGGHRPAGAPCLVDLSEAYATPLGNIAAASELRADLMAALDCAEDTAMDNTVEVQLPLLAAAQPAATLLWVRAPADQAAERLGEFLAAWAERTGTRLAVLGSADLTHYGPDYGFEPAGRGASALAWAADNDAQLCRAALALDTGRVLALAEATQATCSAGAVCCAAAYARARGIKVGRLLELTSSHAVRAAASFVGYAALTYAPA